MSETVDNVKKRKIGTNNNNQKQKQSKLEKPTSIPTPNSSVDNSENNSCTNGDQRIMDAADTLVSLAHSTTPTENKKIIELINQHCNQTNNENNNSNSCSSNTNSANTNGMMSLDSSNSDLFLKSPTASKLIAEFLKHCSPNPNSITTNNNKTNFNNNNNNFNNINNNIIGNSTNNKPNGINNSAINVNEIKKSDENKSNKNDKNNNTNNNNNNNKRSNSISSSYSSSSSANDDLNDAIINNDSSLSQYSLNLSFNDKNSNQIKAEKKSHKRTTSAENRVKYGPIHVRPRSKAAPTLATGRKSKDVELPPDEEKRRSERRERNKEAAAKCRRKREEVAVQLQNRVDILNKEKEDLLTTFEELQNEKRRLENQLKQHEKKCKKLKIEHTVDTAATLAANQLSLFAQLTPPPSSTSIKKIFEENILSTVVPTSACTSTSSTNITTTTTTTTTTSGITPVTSTSKTVDASNCRQPQLPSVKIENDDEQTVKKESPMISGCSPKANLNEVQQEFQQNIIERPKNLNLHCMLLRQDSLNSATNAAMAANAGSFLTAANTASPTFTLNTPIFALTPIEPSTLFSPTNGMQTPRLFAILKPVT